MQPTTALLGVIPARLASTRLPRKALAEIAGVPMIERVYRGARESRALAEIIVATDADEILDFCRRRSIPARMTATTHLSGTDRVWEVAMTEGAEAVVNIQGDEPMVRGAMLDTLVAALFARAECEIATLATPIDGQEAQEPSAVKVVCDARGLARYFSRAPIPFPRDGAPGAYLKHLGYYAYSRGALDQFHALPVSRLEAIEKLEQLRFLENGWEITVAETPHDSIGVDTAEDLARVDAVLRARR
ncbi:MAG: 3-deoxy-manno-octulosonate cytidylyltransferase [Terriglobales bacterium]